MRLAHSGFASAGTLTTNPLESKQISPIQDIPGLVLPVALPSEPTSSLTFSALIFLDIVSPPPIVLAKNQLDHRVTAPQHTYDEFYPYP